MSEQLRVETILAQRPFFILDGGLATELEQYGYDLSDPLWSARLLADSPQAIQQVHRDYLQAGADCLITASYQATVPGFMARGFDREQAIQLLQVAVQLAVQTRDQFWATVGRGSGRSKPLVAVSIGPYGAYLANGGEYTGDYDLDEAGLAAFHRERWHILAEAGGDLLACETIPSFAEARALVRLLAETPAMPVWISFSCRDEGHISDGTPLAVCAKWVAQAPQVVAVGVNCTAPRFIPGLIAQMRQVTDKPIVVYPNSGEHYDPQGHCWLGLAAPTDFAEQSLAWYKAGARLIGGCCRTRPEHIRQIAKCRSQLAARGNDVFLLG